MFSRQKNPFNVSYYVLESNRSNLHLFISVPPNTPQIQSGDDRIDTSRAIAGVYNEGDVMDLTCISVGGKLLLSQYLSLLCIKIIMKHRNDQTLNMKL